MEASVDLDIIDFNNDEDLGIETGDRSLDDRTFSPVK